MPKAAAQSANAVSVRARNPVRALRPAYALFCDDSGGPDDALRSLASVSGPARSLLSLERSLRGVLRASGVAELKWSALRTRPGRLTAARGFLDLALRDLAKGRLRLEVLLWRPPQRADAGRPDDARRLRPLYGRLWRGALRAWPHGRWNLRPDRRTGMRWQEQAAVLERSLGPVPKTGRVLSVREVSSRVTACVQLADLFAGLCRVEGPGSEATDSPAWRKRRALRAYLVSACAGQGFSVREQGGLLSARHRRLNIRLLRRLPLKP